VIRLGFMGPSALWVMFAVAFAARVVLGLALLAARGVGIAAALVASTLLVSSLAAALLVAVAAVAAEMRLAGPPERAPA